jgi:hypothetical protein
MFDSLNPAGLLVHLPGLSFGSSATAAVTGPLPAFPLGGNATIVHRQHASFRAPHRNPRFVLRCTATLTLTHSISNKQINKKPCCCTLHDVTNVPLTHCSRCIFFWPFTAAFFARARAHNTQLAYNLYLRSSFLFGVHKF